MTEILHDHGCRRSPIVTVQLPIASDAGQPARASAVRQPLKMNRAP